MFKSIGNIFKAIARAFVSVAKAIARSTIGRAILTIVACATTGPIGCAATSAGLTLAAGGSIRDAFIAGALSFVQVPGGMGAGGLWGAVGDIVASLPAQAQLIGTVATHAIIGGAVSMAQGGSFETGAITGAVSAGASLLMDSSGVMGKSGDKIPGNVAMRTAVAAVAGGTASVLSGGKFANGAITGAFAQLYNAEGGSKALQYAMAGGEVAASFIPGVGEAQDLYVLGHPNSSLLERTFAGISLVANVLTGGLLPNAGGFIRGAGHLCSFEGETRVETKRGRVAIKDLKPDDEVLARDDKTGQMAFKAIRGKFLNRDPNTARLVVRDRATGTTQTIVTTSNHPFYVAEAAIPELRLTANGGMAEVGTTATGRWVEAGRLEAGARLLNSAGGFSDVVSVTVEDRPLDAYNLEVETFHTFFVAAPANDNAPSVWVHNACPYVPAGVKEGFYLDANTPAHVKGYIEQQLNAGKTWSEVKMPPGYDVGHYPANRGGHIPPGEPNGSRLEFPADNRGRPSITGRDPDWR